MPLGYERCDFVAEQYFVASFNKGTGKKCGDDGSTMQFTGDNQFPYNFGDFINSSVNKNILSRS